MHKKLITVGTLIFTATGASLLTRRDKQLESLSTEDSELVKVEDFKTEMQVPQMVITDSNILSDTVVDLHIGLLMVGVILLVLGLRLKGAK